MSALDMSLEDVIKSKGGNSKRAARAGKAPSNGVKKVQNTERPKSKTATAGLAPALKAAAAAAAAASKPAPAASKAKASKDKDAKDGKEAKPTKPVIPAITPGKAPKGPGGAAGTDDKLGMTLDDVIRVQDTKKKKVTEPRDMKRERVPGLRGRGGFRQRVAQRQMVRKQTKQSARTQVRAVRGRGATRASQKEDFWGGTRTAKAWDGPNRSDWSSERGGGKGGKGERRRAFDEWSDRRDMRDTWRDRRDDWDDWGWEGGKGSSKGGGGGWNDEGYGPSGRGGGGGGGGYGYGAGKGSWAREAPWESAPSAPVWGARPAPYRRPEPMLQWDRAPPAAPVQRVLGAQRERFERPERETPRERLPERDARERFAPRERERPERVERVEKVAEKVRKTIRVCNVPKNLEDRDIQEAFEDIGRVTQCEVERGVAIITFANSSHAKKAVQTFDRGELNGQTIYVSVHEP
ncbi:unnamed protein product [Durusdinium trenchii]|uniref:Uncharacterized protein n=2 Tax=Durusdinium trenchii TaxID=1381693 RepID=A0ABP0NVL3_9DINO